jgi:hypothetical protein
MWKQYTSLHAPPCAHLDVERSTMSCSASSRGKQLGSHRLSHSTQYSSLAGMSSSGILRGRVSASSSNGVSERSGSLITKSLFRCMILPASCRTYSISGRSKCCCTNQACMASSGSFRRRSCASSGLSSRTRLASSVSSPGAAPVVLRGIYGLAAPLPRQRPVQPRGSLRAARLA